MDLADAIHQARELQYQGRPDDAIELLLAAAKEHEDEDLWFEIAAFYFERGLARFDEGGRDAEAEADFVEADRWAELPGTKAGLAALALRRGDAEKAEALAAQALDLEPDEPWARVVLGDLRLRQGRFTEASATLARVVELQPKYAEAYPLLADALVAQGLKELALEALDAGLKKCPGYERMLLAIAKHRLPGDPAGAREALEQAVVINHGNAEAWRHLARLAAKSGDELRMHQALDRAAGIDRDGTLAWIAKESKDVPGLDAFGKP